MSAASSTVSVPAAAAHPGSVLNADTVAAGSSTPGQVCRKTLVDFFEKWELSEYLPDFKKEGYVFVDDLKAADDDDYADGQALAVLLTGGQQDEEAGEKEARANRRDPRSLDQRS
jgi:hypothetical protein